MALFKCKMCGGALEVKEGTTVCECEYCGTKQTIPNTKDEVITNLYNRANNLRLKSEFDKAEQIYEKIVQQDDSQAEAHWGIVLCKYGIEYVEDPATYKRIPTCHRTSYEAIRSDADYQAAIDYADGEQQAIYEAEARAIDKIQKSILDIVKEEKPFDVFICYKETDENGKRTIDSTIANDIYYQLTQEGFKIFYAAITLEDKLGQEYEPYIFAALNSAKVMLVIGTKPEYFNAVWVKNEWSRYLKIISKNRSKLLIPCYRDMDAYDLPEEFSHLQAQDMSKIGFINDITRGIRKVINKEESPRTTQQMQQISNENGNITAFLERGFMALEDKEWERADAFFEQALNFDAKNARAYLGKLMVQLKICFMADLGKTSVDLNDNPNYHKIIRFGDNELIDEIEVLKEQAKQNYLSKFRPAYESAVVRLQNVKTISACEQLKEEFISFGDFMDSKDYVTKCNEKIEWLRNDTGTLKIVFDSSITDSEFGVIVDDKKTILGRISVGKILEFKMQSGEHTIRFFNGSYVITHTTDIKRDKTNIVHMKSTFFNYKIWEEK